jgi:hypothetical protein
MNDIELLCKGRWNIGSIPRVAAGAIRTDD